MAVAGLLHVKDWQLCSAKETCVKPKVLVAYLAQEATRSQAQARTLHLLAVALEQTREAGERSRTVGSGLQGLLGRISSP